MTLVLSPELTRLLQQRAQESGMTPEEMAVETLHRSLLGAKLPPADAQGWAERLKRAASPAGISLSEDALSRETL